MDINPQPNYPFEFEQLDALEVLAGRTQFKDIRRHFDAIHASPPCQAFTNAQVIHGREHADLLTPTRALLEQTGLPWVIENVPGAPMRRDLILCGSMFPELRDGDYGIVRHRWFEFSDPSIAPALVSPCNHPPITVSVFGHGGHVYHGVEQWRRVMGIDWTTRDELAQAIPPQYTELIGHRLLESSPRSEVLILQHLENGDVGHASGSSDGTKRLPVLLRGPERGTVLGVSGNAPTSSAFHTGEAVHLELGAEVSQRSLALRDELLVGHLGVGEAGFPYGDLAGEDFRGALGDELISSHGGSLGYHHGFVKGEM